MNIINQEKKRILKRRNVFYYYYEDQKRVRPPVHSVPRTEARTHALTRTCFTPRYTPDENNLPVGV